MSRVDTAKMFVNLSASQARKRLKKRGLGVRRVEAVDRNQAVLVHTATGDHLDELQALFADVMASGSRPELDVPLENLRNLGPATAAWLREIGVRTREDLRRLGPVLAYRRVQQRQPAVSLNLLWALEAALADCDWRTLGDDVKTRLRRELAEH